jgi:hypothetical protein
MTNYWAGMSGKGNIKLWRPYKKKKGYLVQNQYISFATFPTPLFLIGHYLQGVLIRTRQQQKTSEENSFN